MFSLVLIFVCRWGETYLRGRPSVHGAMGRRIDPLRWNYFSFQPAGVTKTVVYTILSVGWCFLNGPLLDDSRHITVNVLSASLNKTFPCFVI